MDINEVGKRFELITLKLKELSELSKTKERSGTFTLDAPDLAVLAVEPETDRDVEELLNLPYCAMSNIEIEKLIDYKANLRAFTLYLEMIKSEDSEQLEVFRNALANVVNSDPCSDAIAEYIEVD